MPLFVQSQSDDDRRLLLPSDDGRRRVLCSDAIGSVVYTNPVRHRFVLRELGTDHVLVTYEDDLHVVVVVCRERFNSPRDLRARRQVRAHRVECYPHGCHRISG